MSNFVVGFLTAVAVVMLAIWAGVDRKYLVLQKTVQPVPPVLHPCSNYHDLTLIGVQHLPDDRNPISLILKRCKVCTQHIVFPTPGIWTITELLRERSEVAELEGMLK